MTKVIEWVIFFPFTIHVYISRSNYLNKLKHSVTEKIKSPMLVTPIFQFFAQHDLLLPIFIPLVYMFSFFVL